MSTTSNNHNRTRQIALSDDPDEAPVQRTRARDQCFREFLDYYDKAEIRVHGTLAEHPDPWQVDSFTIKRRLGNGSRLNLVECPIDGCHAPFAPGESASEHFLAEHEPEDVGLSPIKTPVDERSPNRDGSDTADTDDCLASDLLVDDRELDTTDGPNDDEDEGKSTVVNVPDDQALLGDW